MYKRQHNRAFFIYAMAALLLVTGTSAMAQNRRCYYERDVQEHFAMCEDGGGIAWRNGIVMRQAGVYHANDTLANPTGRCDSIIHYEGVLVTYPCDEGESNAGGTISGSIIWQDPATGNQMTSSMIVSQNKVFVISARAAELRPTAKTAETPVTQPSTTLDIDNLDEASDDGSVTISPNPARLGDHLDVDGCDEGTIELYDAEGHLLRDANLIVGLTLDSRLKKGTYYAKIIASNGKTWVRKLEVR